MDLSSNSDLDMYQMMKAKQLPKSIKFLNFNYEREREEEEEYEYLTMELIKQDKKFYFQEQANHLFQTLSSSLNSKNVDSTQTTLASMTSSMSSQKTSKTSSQTALQNIKQLINIQQNPVQFLKSVNMLQQWIQLNSEKRPKLNVIGLCKIIGEGSQGKVMKDYVQIGDESGVQSNDQSGVIAVALKYIQDIDQYKREVLIMEQLEYEYHPRVIFYDNLKQVICMELCICTLQDFSNMKGNNIYLQDDKLVASLLLRLMNRIVQLMKQNIIHGDIKPSNTAFAIRNNSIELVLIDFGAASNSASDYCNYYTKAFCHQKVLDVVLNEEIIQIDSIIFNELFAACRTIQYILLSDKKSLLFSQNNYEAFKTSFQQSHPITMSIITLFFGNSQCTFTYYQFDQMIQYYSSIFQDCFHIDINYLLENSQIFKI